MSEISMADVHRLLHVLHSNGLIRAEDIARLIPAHRYPTDHASSGLVVSEKLATEHEATDGGAGSGRSGLHPYGTLSSNYLPGEPNGPAGAAPALLDKAKLVFGMLKDKSTFGNDGVVFQRDMREEWQ